MDKTVFRVRAFRPNDNYYCFIPASPADKRFMNSFCGEAGNQIITVTAEIKRVNKTYEQIKLAWALISICCEINYGHKPVGDEADNMCQALYKMFAEEYEWQNPLTGEIEKNKITMSKMSKAQMCAFINNIINYLAQDCDLNTTQQIGVKEIFEQYMSFRSELKEDFVDMDAEGNYISIEEFRRINTISFASGMGGALELAHIVSRGTAPQFEECSWNVMMLTPEEHKLQHQAGWEKFLEIYPHLRGRVERARKMAHKLGLQPIEEKVIDFNDMEIVTPSGNEIEMNPEDFHIATKVPEDEGVKDTVMSLLADEALESDWQNNSYGGGLF